MDLSQSACGHVHESEILEKAGTRNLVQVHELKTYQHGSGTKLTPSSSHASVGNHGTMVKHTAAPAAALKNWWMGILILSVKSMHSTLLVFPKSLGVVQVMSGEEGLHLHGCWQDS